MSFDPNVWEIGENITIELFVADPNTGEALTGQTSFITLTIRRDSDSKYWTGIIWTSGLTNLSVSEVSAANNPGRYIYVLFGANGNNTKNRYVAHAHIINPPFLNFDDYEIHVSRTVDVRVYESEPN